VEPAPWAGSIYLWYGILLCDVLRDEPTLRGVPLPVPLNMVSCNNGMGAELGCPHPFWGIAFIKGGSGNPDDCLKLVHLEATLTLVRGKNYDGEWSSSYNVHDWAVVTYTNTAMTSSFQDWRMDCRIQASDIIIDDKIKSELLQSGLLGPGLGQTLQNLVVSHPTPDISAAAHEGVVYLIARKKYRHPQAWVLAVDTRNKTLVGAAEFGTERQPYGSFMYFASDIAKYIKPDTTGIISEHLFLNEKCYLVASIDPFLGIK